MENGNIQTKEGKSDISLLQEAVSLGIISLSVEDIQNRIDMAKRQDYLNLHGQTNKTWQGKNGSWYTYVPDSEAPRGIRLVRKSTLDKLQDEVVNHYKAMDEAVRQRAVTLDSIREEWINYKDLESPSESYAARLEYDYDRFWKDTDIVKKPIKSIDRLTLETFILRMVEERHMTKRQYSDMKSVINMMYDYAVTKGIISENIARGIVIKRNKFAQPPKKKNTEQVFLTSEQKELVEAVMEDFRKNPDFTTPLVIPLGFQIGDRAGELVALKASDIEGNYLHIQRQEVTCFKVVDGMRKKNGWKVVSYTKTEAGDRTIYLTPQAREIISLLVEANKRNGYDPDGYLFMHNGEKIHCRAVDSQLRKYCRHIGIKAKSNHKIRKTFGSALVDSKMSIEKAAQIMGHTDKRTLLSNYCFNRYDDRETEAQMEEALCI